jgi:hypothetical protein
LAYTDSVKNRTWAVGSSQNERLRSDLGESSPRVSMTRRKWGGRRRCVPAKVDGGSAGDPGHQEVHDEVQEETPNSKASQGGLGVALVDRKVRTEKFPVVAASATDGCIVLEILEMIGGVREMREDEVNQLVPEGAALTRLIDGFASVLAAAMGNSGEQFLRPGGDWEVEKRGYRGGRRGLYIEANREALDGCD